MPQNISFWVLLDIFAQTYILSDINRLARRGLVDVVMMPNFTPGRLAPRTGGLLRPDFPSKAGGFLTQLTARAASAYMGGRLTFVAGLQLRKTHLGSFFIL